MREGPAVLIDLDGTLVDSVPDLTAALNRTRAELGLTPLTPPQVAARVGQGARVLVRESLVPDFDATWIEGHLEKVLGRFLTHYASTNGLESRLYPGVVAGLRRFGDLGLPLACVTNKPTAQARALLQKLGILDPFETVVGDGDSTRLKPFPDPFFLALERLRVPRQAGIVVGDSANDARAAQAAGLPLILVSYGYHQGADLRRFGADAIVDTLEQAARWIDTRGA